MGIGLRVVPIHSVINGQPSGGGNNWEETSKALTRNSALKTFENGKMSCGKSVLRLLIIKIFAVKYRVRLSGFDYFVSRTD